MPRWRATRLDSEPRLLLLRLGFHGATAIRQSGVSSADGVRFGERQRISESSRLLARMGVFTPRERRVRGSLDHLCTGLSFFGPILWGHRAAFYTCMYMICIHPWGMHKTNNDNDNNDNDDNIDNINNINNNDDNNDISNDQHESTKS